MRSARLHRRLRLVVANGNSGPTRQLANVLGVFGGVILVLGDLQGWAFARYEAALLLAIYVILHVAHRKIDPMLVWLAERF